MRGGFIVLLALVLPLTGYACWHLWRITPQGWKWVVVGLFLLWMASMFAGFAYMERIPVKAACVLYEVGNTWLIAFMYLLIVFVLADIASLCHLLPKTLLKDSASGLFSALGIVALILTLGAIHYHHKYREELTITTEKPLEKPLTIVLASDLHIGYHNRRAELARWIDLFINVVINNKNLTPVGELPASVKVDNNGEAMVAMKVKVPETIGNAVMDVKVSGDNYEAQIGRAHV